MEVEVKDAEEAAGVHKSARDMINAARQAVTGIVQNMTAGGKVSPQMIMVFLAGFGIWMDEVLERFVASYTFIMIENDKLVHQVQIVEEQLRIADISLEEARKLCPPPRG